MVRLVKVGEYLLSETKTLIKILYLSEKGTYAWINAKGIGEILVSSQIKSPPEYTQASGKYRIYNVKDELKLTDTTHLELYIGKGNWQGYLLPTGLPNNKNKRKRIIPTKELITKANLSQNISTEPILVQDYEYL